MDGPRAFRYILLCVCLALTAANHFRGGSITWKPTQIGKTVTIYYRLAWTEGSSQCDDYLIQSNSDVGIDSGWRCFIGCSMYGPSFYRCTDNSTTERWSSGRNSFDFTFPYYPDHFEFGYSGSAWMNTVYGSGNWMLRAKANLTNRPDTGLINSSPFVDMPPVVRINAYCNNEIRIPVSDDDGDTVRCRWALSSLNECGGKCNGLPHAHLYEDNCTISYYANHGTGYYAVTIQVEDYNYFSSEPLSSVPVQFVVHVVSGSGYCNGYSEPRFVGNTPMDNDTVFLDGNSAFTINVVSNREISEITTISPLGVTKSPLQYDPYRNTYFINVTLSEDDDLYNLTKVFCFSATDTAGYSSEQRCININMGYQIRLTGYGRQDKGNVEVFLGGQWRRVCDTFPFSAARVACRSLGYADVRDSGSGSYHYDHVFTYLNCDGNEQNLRECMTQNWQDYPWGGCYDWRLTCGNTPIRLVDGPHSGAGRVEVMYGGRWGTVCDDSFDSNDARVICRMLGHNDSTAVRSYQGAYYGQGSGDIIIDELHCNGYETDISKCGSLPWLKHDCSHGEDASVDCGSGFRLADGPSNLAGRVEYLKNGNWYSLCGRYFTDENAEVMCMALGFNYTTNATADYGPGYHSVDHYGFVCNGDESDLSQCQTGPYRYCNSYDRAGVDCRTKLRLTGYGRPNEGYLELFYNGQWREVCSNYLSYSAKEVACRTMGYNSLSNYNTGYYVYNSPFTQFNCDGSEDDLGQCITQEWQEYPYGGCPNVFLRCENYDTTEEMTTPYPYRYTTNWYWRTTMPYWYTTYRWWLTTQWYGTINSGCTTTQWADIVFILDASGSVSSSDFQTMLDFVKTMVNGFTIGPSETQIGVLTFDDTTYLQFNLNRYYTKYDVLNAISNIRYTGGGTETAGAIRYARQYAFQPQNGMRVNSAKIAIIVTDGQSGNAQETALEAQRLRALGITIFSIGVGSGPTMSELNAMATDPDSSHVFLVNNYYALDSIKSALQRQACEVTAAPAGIGRAFNVSCDTSGWIIDVDLQLLRLIYPGARGSDIYLGDNSCTGIQIGWHLEFRQSLIDCLTSRTVSNDTLLYRNQLIYAMHDPLHPFIIRNFNWTVNVECDVTRSESATGHIHHDSASHANQSIVGTGNHYAVNMTFYKDPSYYTPIPGNPLHVAVGTDVYAKVFTSAVDWSIKMRVHSCYTKPSPGAPEHLRYYLIKDGCEVDVNTHLISQSTHETKFVFQEFEYTTNHEGLYIYCDATFCPSTDYSAQCLQTCSPHSSRVGRSAPLDAQTVSRRIVLVHETT